MPFKSEAQRRLMWLRHPKIAKRWAHEYPEQKGLPMHVASAAHAAKRTQLNRKKRGSR